MPELHLSIVFHVVLLLLAAVCSVLLSLFVYRITVLARGVLPGTAVVLQALWSAPANPVPGSTQGGTWHSWQVLTE